MAGNIILQWSASASSNVAGYYVYYGTASGVYSSKIDAGNATSATIPDLTPGVVYYFVATAYDAQGDQSTFSTEVSYLVPASLAMISGTTPTAPPSLQFPAATGHWYEIQATTNLVNWCSIWQSDTASSNSLISFSDTNAASFGARFYRLVLH